MTIYLKNGTTIKYENDPDIIADFNVLKGYITIKKLEKLSYYTMMIMPKESLNFIDWENSKEAGVIKQIY